MFFIIYQNSLMLRSLLPVVLAQFLIQIQKTFVSQSLSTNATAIIISSKIQMNETNTDDVQMFFHHVWNNALSLATLLVLINLISNISQHYSRLGLSCLGARMRIGCCSLIYRKVIRSI